MAYVLVKIKNALFHPIRYSILDVRYPIVGGFSEKYLLDNFKRGRLE